MDKNPPANAGDTCSVPELGRFHMPRSTEAHEPPLPSLRTAATEARVPIAFRLQQESHCDEKPVRHNEK